MREEPKEEVVWVHTGGQELQTSTPNLVYRCSNCKKGIHSYVDAKDGVVLRCTKANEEMCQCLCKVKYQCKYGRLHPYGMDCECKELEFPKRKPTPELDKIVAQANLYYQQQRNITESRKQ